MIGGQPVVPTTQIKREAKRILDEVPKDAQGNPIFGDPRILKSLQQIGGLSPKITVGEARRIRNDPRRLRRVHRPDPRHRQEAV